MRRLAIVVLLPALVVVPAAAASRDGLPVPQLVRVAAKLTGTAPPAKLRVVAASRVTVRAKALRAVDRDYPKARQAYDQELYLVLGILRPTERLRPLLVRSAAAAGSVYDPARRTLDVRRGAQQRALALEGLVRVLTQRSPLRPKRARSADADALAASAAALEGSTQLALHGVRTRVPESAPRGPRGAAFVGLRSAFADAVGTRLASILFNVGGQKAVQGLLRRPPLSTEQVFHVDKYLERERPLAIALPPQAGGFELTAAEAFGELDLRALLAVFRVPGANAVAAGWGGGRSAIYRDTSGARAVVLRLDWDEDTDADQWIAAVPRYLDAAFDTAVPGLPAAADCDAASCWSLGGRAVALARDGARTALVLGAGDAPSAAALAAAVVAPVP